MKNLPKIRAEFYFIGEFFDISSVTDIMKIEPSLTRERDSFLEANFAKTIWMIQTKKENCKVLSWKIEEIIKNLLGKEEFIKDICRKYNIQAGFQVKIWIKNGYKPDMMLTPEIICFLASIGAEIGFDLYVD